MHVRIYSYGGSGLKFLSGIVNSQAMRSYSPHIVPIIDSDFNRIIYIYADPIEAVMSFFKREQERSGWVNCHLRNLGRDCIDYTTFGDFTQDESDPFGLEKHFDYWLSTKFSCPVAFIKYEQLTKVSDNIAEFLKFENTTFSDNIKNEFRSRHSSQSFIEPDNLKKLKKKFCGLYNKMNELEDFWIKQ